MKWLGKILGWGKIKNKFLLVTMTIGIIPLLALGCVSFLISTDNIIKSYTEVASSNLYIANSIVNILSKDIEALSRRLLASSVVAQAMQDGREFPDGSTYLDAKATRQLNAEIKASLPDGSLISTVYLFGNRGFKYGYNAVSKGDIIPYPLISFSDFESSGWYRQTVEANGGESYFLYNVLGTYGTQFAASPYVSVTKQLKDLKTGEAYGVLIINLYKKYYDTVYPQVIRKKNASYLLADGRGGKPEYISFSDTMPDTMASAVSSYLDGETENGSYLILSYKNRKTGWNLIHVIKKSEVIADNLAIPIVTLIAAMALIAVSAALSFISAHAITQPLEKLSAAITEMEQSGHTTIESFGDDDVGVIGNRFKRMAEQKEELNGRIIKLSVLEKEAELNNLQSQINPHFLYNTLASMYWLSKFGKQEDVAQMAIALSDIFKFALNKGKNTVTVDMELQYIERYIKIQNLRYGNRINVTWDIDAQMRDKTILKLILQPLVENAIYHGLELKVGEWRLSITGRLLEDGMYFVIEDNGVGMDAGHAVAHGFGINNVSERIRLKYGEGYGCAFESGIGKGTRVTVCVPCEEEGES